MAPAGQAESAYAALAFGADAVYAGLPRFSARAEAANLTPDALGELVAYAHSLSPARRVYVALNTLVRDDEWAEALEAILLCAELGVDALIVQDLGIARLARRHAPGLRLHASTQLALHSRAGVEAARELGFHRVTLARELTLDEIRSAARAPGIEVETFVHGALCYSYSGLCLYSSLVLGRSGNRGRCAYLCRDRFRFDPAGLRARGPEPDSGFFFSMKDLMLADHVPVLREAGVAALKIEGRMKSPLYVAAVVHFYRRLLDGTLTPGDRTEAEADLQTIFSRPWTDLYLPGRRRTGVIEPAFLGHRGRPAGTIEAVLPGQNRGPTRLRFRTRAPLERHDGLQLDLPGQDWPFGFPVDSLRICGPGRRPPASAYEAPAGALVEVELPAGHPAVSKGCPVSLSSSQAVKRRYVFERPKPGAFRARVPLAIRVILGRTEAAASAQPETAGPAGWTAEARVPGPFESAREPAAVEQAVRAAFEKLGNTGFRLGRIEVLNPDRVFIPVSRLNDLRRNLTARAESLLRETRRQQVTDILVRERTIPAEAPGTPKAVAWSLKFRTAAESALFEDRDWEGVGDVTLALGAKPVERAAEEAAALARHVGRDRLRLALPLITRAWEEAGLAETIRRLADDGWRRWEAAGLSAWTWLRGMAPASGKGLDLAADWSVYALNRQAVRLLREMGATRIVLSPEDGLANARALAEEAGSVLAFLVFQDTPLFVSETCVRTGGAGKGGAACSECSAEVALVSSHGDRIVALMDACRTVVLSDRPLCRAGRLEEIRAAGTGWLRADFSWRPRPPEAVRDLWRRLRAGQARPEDEIGNLERGLA
jgi:putative protease